jgi:hypothetical protein
MPKESSKKNTVQDIVPKQRTIRNIDLPSRRAKVSEVPIQTPVDIEPPKNSFKVSQSPPPCQRKKAFSSLK